MSPIQLPKNTQIKSLTKTPRMEIFEAMKSAFTNYVIPLDFNPDLHLKRWEISGIDFDYSYGVFENEKLVAFILHIPLKDALYNFGTGVIPEARGRHYVDKIYQTVLKEHPEIKKLRLEVIQNNLRAYRLYEKLGFHITRELYSYEGLLLIPAILEKKYEYHVRSYGLTEEMRAISLMRPASESSHEVLFRNAHMHEVHELRMNHVLCAYAVYSPYNGTLKEVGAQKGIEELLDQLFIHMRLQEQKVRLMNVEEKAQELREYLTSRNLSLFVSQYEMDRLVP